MSTGTGAHSSSLFGVPPLSSGEVEEFLAFFPESNMGSHAMFRALSGETQAMIWRARQQGIVNDASLSYLLSTAMDDLRNSGWGNESVGHRLVDKITRASLLVAEAVHRDCPVQDMDSNMWMYLVRTAVVGAGHRKGGQPSSIPVFKTVDEIAPVAGFTAFVLGARGLKAVSMIIYQEEDFSFRGMCIPNPALRAFVRKYPEHGYRLGRFAEEHDLGTSKDDAQVAFSFLAETSNAKAVSDGWL